MRVLVRGLVFLIATYLACWTVVYGIIMAGDFRYFFRYLFMAWSRPGEIPALIQLYAIGATLASCLVAGVVLLAIRRRKSRVKS